MGNPGELTGAPGHANLAPEALITLNDVQHQTLTAVQALAQRVAELDAKLDQLSASSAASAAKVDKDISDMLHNLTHAIALNAHGQTLISLVQEIHDAVYSIKDHLYPLYE